MTGAYTTNVVANGLSMVFGSYNGTAIVLAGTGTQTSISVTPPSPTW